MYDLNKSKEKGLKLLENFHQKAAKKGYKVIALTASGTDLIALKKHQYKHTFEYYFCDATTLKTIERASPSIVVLEKGVIVQKVHFNDIDKVVLK